MTPTEDPTVTVWGEKEHNWNGSRGKPLIGAGVLNGGGKKRLCHARGGFRKMSERGEGSNKQRTSYDGGGRLP